MDEFKELEQQRADVLRLAEVYTGLNNVREIIRTTLDTHEPVSDSTMDMLRLSVNQELTRLPQDVVVRQLSTESQNDSILTVSLESIGQNIKAVWDALVKKLKQLWEKIKTFVRTSFNRVEAICRNLKSTVANLDSKEYVVSGTHLASLFPNETNYQSAFKTIPVKLDGFITKYQTHNDRIAKALDTMLREAIAGWKNPDIESTVLSRLDQLQRAEFGNPVTTDADLLLGYVNPDFRELTQQFTSADDASGKLVVLGQWHPTRNRENAESTSTGRIQLHVSDADVKQVTEELYSDVKRKFDQYVEHIDTVLASLTAVTKEGSKIAEVPDEEYTQHSTGGNLVQSLLFRTSINLPDMYTWSTRYLISAFEFYDGVIRSLKPAEG